MLKQFFILALLIVLCGQVSLSQIPNSWNSEPSCPFNLRNMASFTIGHNIYFGTGQLSSPGTASTGFWKYNTKTRMWSTLADFPGSSRRHACGFAINGKGYIGMGVSDSIPGGYNYFHDFYQYDTLTNSWTPIASFPIGVGFYTTNNVAFAVNGKGYICIGTNSAGNNYIYEYNPATNVWSHLSLFPGAPRKGGVAFVIGNKAYVGTGFDSASNSYLNDFYSYNTSADIWTPIASLPSSGRAYGIAFSICNLGYAGLGTSSSPDDFYQYDPATNTWNTMNNFPGSGIKGLLYSGINVPGDTSFGFCGLGGGSDFYRYVPPVLCLGVSVRTELKGNGLQLYPNPAKTFIHIKSSNVISDYCIRSLLGAIIKSPVINKKTFAVDISDFPRGFSAMEFRFNDGTSQYELLLLD